MIKKCKLEATKISSNSAGRCCELWKHIHPDLSWDKTDFTFTHVHTRFSVKMGSTRRPATCNSAPFISWHSFVTWVYECFEWCHRHSSSLNPYYRPGTGGAFAPVPPMSRGGVSAEDPAHLLDPFSSPKGCGVSRMNGRGEEPGVQQPASCTRVQGPSAPPSLGCSGAAPQGEAAAILHRV